MSRLGPIGRPVVLLMLTGVLAISCAAPSVYIPAGSRVAAPTVGARQQDSHIEVEVEHLIVPNAPGSWIKDAPWYEVVFRLRNASSETVTVMQVAMVSEQGAVAPQIGYEAVYQIVSKLRDQGEAANTGGGTLGYILSHFIPGIGGSIVGSAVTPNVGAPAAASAQQQAALIEREFRARQAMTATLVSGGASRGSAFFSARPRRLRVSYTTSQGMRELLVSVAPPASGS